MLMARRRNKKRVFCLYMSSGSRSIKKVKSYQIPVINNNIISNIKALSYWSNWVPWYMPDCITCWRKKKSLVDKRSYAHLISTIINNSSKPKGKMVVVPNTVHKVITNSTKHQTQTNWGPLIDHISSIQI